MRRLIHVINSGSSSIKYSLIDVADPHRPITWAHGLLEAIGEDGSHLTHQSRIAGGDPDGPFTTTESRAPVADHRAGFAAIDNAFNETGPVAELGHLTAFGHRVVHGGEYFSAPALIDDKVVRTIEACIPLAPLHNPANLAGIKAAQATAGDVPNVAVFDTAFHQSMPPVAYTYALDRELAREHGIRRYGFHGTSHDYVSRRCVDLLDLDPGTARIITLHLGNGASACAVQGGRSINTSMGMTPLEGLVMGTRTGDIDPALPLHLQRVAGLGADEVDSVLNKRSGLKGLTGHNDLREIHELVTNGDSDAAVALDIYAQRIRHYLAAYFVDLGGAHAIVFTAGVGEHDADMRARVCADLDWLGVRLDSARNSNVEPGRETVISAPDSGVTVTVIPTDEEGEIARQAAAVTEGAGKPQR